MNFDTNGTPYIFHCKKQQKKNRHSNNAYKERNRRFNCIPKRDGSCAHIIFTVPSEKKKLLNN